jgi:6-pyruvoyltetrahydropterin/6-carboxytetrahydropterin synthase
MPSCTRRFTFAAGHRVLGHIQDGMPGKCASLHGHGYVAEVTCYAGTLNDLEMVVDFGVVKKLVGTWIEENWDHRMILWKEDPLYILWEELGPELGGKLIGERGICSSMRNPTAEALSEWLCHEANKLLADADLSVRCSHVRIYETENCWSDFCWFIGD